MANMGLHGGADLRTHALIGPQQGHVAVRRAAGDDLDEPGLVEVLEPFDDAAIECLEVIERLREEALPEARRLRIVGLTGLGEERLVFPGGDNFAFHVFRKLGEEDRVGKLLHQDRREV